MVHSLKLAFSVAHTGSTFRGNYDKMDEVYRSLASKAISILKDKNSRVEEQGKQVFIESPADLEVENHHCRQSMRVN